MRGMRVRKVGRGSSMTRLLFPLAWIASRVIARRNRKRPARVLNAFDFAGAYRDSFDAALNRGARIIRDGYLK